MNCRTVPYLPSYRISPGNDDEKPNENQVHSQLISREFPNLPISTFPLVLRGPSSPTNPQPTFQQRPQPFNIRIHLHLYLRMDPCICIFDHGP